jgi:predicted GNAT superfamily acetyltransferase
MVIREAGDDDHAAVLALNNSAVPHVNALTPEEFAWIVAHAGYFRVAIDDGGLAGFVIAFPPGVDYWSLNYRWFSEFYRGAGFFYLDRVVVTERARGSGVGRALYDDLGRFVAGTWSRIALEVNLLPPNPGSLAFHERLGFRRVGVREEDNGAKAVVLMERAISSSTPDTDGPSS